MFKHIPIRTDGSTLSTQAAKIGIAPTKALRAKVTVFCAPEDLLPIFRRAPRFVAKIYRPNADALS